MGRAGWKHWYMTRFVIGSEIIGYVLSLSVIGFAIASNFIPIDVTMSVAGDLVPTQHDVVLAEDAAIVRQLAEAGSEVAADAPLLEVATDAAAVADLLARRHLARAAALLEHSSAADAAGRARTLGELASAKPSIDAMPRTLRAPAAGVFTTGGSPDDLEPIGTGKALATVHDLTTFQVVATISADQAGRLEAGMPARTRPPGADAPLAGEVIEVRNNADPIQVVIAFREIPGALKEKHRAALVETGKPGADSNISVQVTTGQQSLFSRLFSRK